MEVAISLAVGIPVGVFQSVLMLWIVFRGFSPRLEWSAPIVAPTPSGKGNKESEIVVTVANFGKRDAVDVAYHAELRVEHDATVDDVTRTVIRLPLNSSWMPRLRRSGRARIRIEDSRVDPAEWERLKSRTGIGTSNLVQILESTATASIRLYALASDPFSGSRQVFVSADLEREHIANHGVEMSHRTKSGGTVMAGPVEGQRS